MVTDNTSSVRNAREIIERKYGRAITSQDQAHAADKLLEDFGETSWIKGDPGKVLSIGSDIRRFRKLRAKLIELVRAYNRRICGPRTGTSGRSVRQPERTAVPDRNHSNNEVESTHDKETASIGNPNGDEPVMNFLNSCSSDRGPEDDIEEEEESAGISGSHGEATLMPENIEGRRARLVKKVSVVRFASCKKLLDEYISIKPVLKVLVQDPSFSLFYTVKNGSERQLRKEKFIDPILDDSLLAMVVQLHKIFHACRTYLRVLDAEGVWSSEVFEATRIIEESIERLPLESFPRPRHIHHKLLKNVFRNRMKGPFIGYKKIQVPLLSDLHIAAALLDPYRTPCDDHPAWDDYMTVFRRHMDKYFQGVDLGSDNRATWRFTERMIHLYLEARSIWAERGILRSQSRPSVQEQAHANKVANVSAISWWRTGALPIPQDKEGKEARKKLCEFAHRTLAVSPTSTATEQSFGHEKRIHSLQRANLLPDGVTKVLFCQWNSRFLRDGADKN